MLLFPHLPPLLELSVILHPLDVAWRSGAEGFLESKREAYSAACKHVDLPPKHMCRGNDNRTADRAEEFGKSPGRSQGSLWCRAHCASQLTAGKLLFSLLFTNALPGDFYYILSSPFSVLATSRCHAARALLCYTWGKRTQRVHLGK